ncbi:MAG: thiamine pyrophosphate-binding protein [Trueperaceae bacterium]
MRKHGGQLVVDSLLAEGVSKLFTVPGESFLPVLDALYDVPERIELISTRHEEGAGFAAEGYAKASGEPGVCIVTRGPGATNLSIALHTAQQDSTPLVALVGQVPTGFRHRRAFQEVDFVSFFSPLVKWAIEIPQTARIPELLQQAFRVATSERPGPVVVSLPEDILTETTPANALASVRLRSPRPDARSVGDALRLLLTAKAPVLIAGREVLTSGATPLLTEFAEALAIPVMTAFRRFDAFPNDHGNYVGNLGLAAPEEALAPLADADLVLGLGAQFTQMTTSQYRYPKPNTQLIHVTASQESSGSWGSPSLAIVADTRSFLQDCLAELKNSQTVPRSQSRRQARVKEYRAFYRKLTTFESRPASGPGRMSISALLASVKEIAPEDSAIVSDAGNFSGWISRYYPFTSPLTHFGPISGAMGYALPAAIGVSCAEPLRAVFAFAGDGGFAMTMNELSTVRKHDMKIVTIVFVNDLHGTIRVHQEKRYPGRRIGTDLCNPSFTGIANAYGIPSTRVAENADFHSAFGEALSRNGPSLIEVHLGDERLSAWPTRPVPVESLE